MYSRSLHVVILAGLLLGVVVNGAPTPGTASSRLDEDESRTFLRGWLLFDDPTNEGVRRKGPTAKSVFIAPVVKDLPDCARGYYADALGRCHKIVQINQSAQLSFLLQKLNAMYANNDRIIQRPGTTEGPFQVPIPLAALQSKPVISTTTVTEKPWTTTTEIPVTEEVDMMVVAAEVQIKDDRQSISLPGAIVTLWHLNTTTTDSPPQITTSNPDDVTDTSDEEDDDNTTLEIEDVEDVMLQTQESTTSTEVGTTSTKEETASTETIPTDGTTQFQEGSTILLQQGTTQSDESTGEMFEREITTKVPTSTYETTTLKTTDQPISTIISTTEKLATTSIFTREKLSTTPPSTEVNLATTSVFTREKLSTTPTSTTEKLTATSIFTREQLSTTPTSTAGKLSTTPVPSGSLSIHVPDNSGTRVIDSADLSSANSAEQPLTFKLPLDTDREQPTWNSRDRPLKWPTTDREPHTSHEDGTAWSWGSWHSSSSTSRPPLYLNFWTSQPHVPDPTIRTRTGLRQPPSRYPAVFNGRPAPLYYQELTGQDVASVFRHQDAWYRGHQSHHYRQ